MKGFKQCSNGHWYKNDLTQCPFCKGKATPGNADPTITKGGNTEETRVPPAMQNAPPYNKMDSNKTELIQEDSPAPRMSGNIPNANMNMGHDTTDRTQFVEEIEVETGSGHVEIQKESRSSRRLVGWLVTYSIDPLGIDFKIYEGRNVVGRSADCNITVNDKTMSGTHATILFRADKYKIKDELSAHGTFVNGEDIETDAIDLHDGDVIAMGETMFLFKSSLQQK